MSGGLTGVPCPKCRKPVAAAATRCPHCHSDFTPDEIAARKNSLRRYIGIGCGGALGLLLLIGLIGSIESGDPAAAEFIKLPGLNNNIMIVPDDMPAEGMLAAAKDKCGREQMCQVLAWTDRNAAARALPMTDPELAALAFSYSINRSSGHEQATWDCKRYPRNNPEECMAKD